MICPNCREKSLTVDTRSDDGKTYRKHRCPKCGTSFYTIEMVDNAAASQMWQIIKAKSINRSRKMNDNREICGRCTWAAKEDGELTCQCEDSDGYGCPVGYTDSCTEYEVKDDDD